MSRRHPTRGVVFDLDGTLLDSLPLVLRAFTHALAPFGGNPTMDMFAHFGGPPEKIFSSLIPDSRDVPAALIRLHEFHRDNHNLIEPFAGAKSMLAMLQTRGVKLAVWTGRDRASTADLFAIHGLAEFFTVVVCGDDLPSHKPDPAGLLEILARLAVSPSEVLYLGDADVDVAGGAGAGVDTILIQHARSAKPEIATLAWRLVAAPHEAYEWALRCTRT